MSRVRIRYNSDVSVALYRLCVTQSRQLYRVTEMGMPGRLELGQPLVVHGHMHSLAYGLSNASCLLLCTPGAE